MAKKSLDAKGGLGKVSQMPSQVSATATGRSAKPTKTTNQKAAMVQGPFGGKVKA